MAVFDEGHLRDDTKQAAVQLENLMNVMNGTTPSSSMPVNDTLLEVFTTVWYRVAEVSRCLDNRSISQVLTIFSDHQRVFDTYAK